MPRGIRRYSSIAREGRNQDRFSGKMKQNVLPLSSLFLLLEEAEDLLVMFWRGGRRVRSEGRALKKSAMKNESLGESSCKRHVNSAKRFVMR